MISGGERKSAGGSLGLINNPMAISNRTAVGSKHKKA